MRSTIIFVLLQYIIGFAFAVTGIFLFAKLYQLSLDASIFYSFMVGFLCMMAGVNIIGYFHLRKKKVLYRFGKALALSFAGLLLFILLYIFIEKFLPAELGILMLFLPLTGAVFGFNLMATMSTNSEAN